MDNDSLFTINPLHDIWIFHFNHLLHTINSRMINCCKIFFNPLKSVLRPFFDQKLLILLQMIFKTLLGDWFFDCITILFKLNFGFNFHGHQLIILSELLSFSIHSVKVFRRESTLLFSNRDCLCILHIVFIHSCNIQDSVCINLESHLNFSFTFFHCWDPFE